MAQCEEKKDKNRKQPINEEDGGSKSLENDVALSMEESQKRVMVTALAAGHDYPVDKKSLKRATAVSEEEEEKTHTAKVRKTNTGDGSEKKNVRTWEELQLAELELFVEWAELEHRKAKLALETFTLPYG